MTPPIARKPADALPPELFRELARNAPLLVVCGVTGAIVGGLAAILAGALFVFWDARVAKAAAGVVFFYASLILTPSIHLLNYRAEILAAAAAPDGDRLAKVLRQQVRFWRFAGVATILVMVLIGTAVLLR